MLNECLPKVWGKYDRSICSLQMIGIITYLGLESWSVPPHERASRRMIYTRSRTSIGDDSKPNYNHTSKGHRSTAQVMAVARPLPDGCLSVVLIWIVCRKQAMI